MTGLSKSKRNGKIEFLRFLFCMIVVLYHTRSVTGLKNLGSSGLTFFAHGRAGVEFFFLLSGYFLTKTAFSVLERNDSPDISRETVLFTLKKYLSVFFVHILAFLPLLTAKLIFLKNDSVFLTAVKSIPGALLMTKSGIAEFDVIESEWYLSKMLLAGMILFPLILRFRETFTRIVCPVMGFMLIGCLVHGDGVLGDVNIWVFNESVPKTFVRALAEMSLGAVLFEITEYLSLCRPSPVWKKTIYAVMELLLYACAVYFMMLPSGDYEAYALGFLFAGLVLSFSGRSATDRLFDNRFCRWLGKLSLPVYLCQGIIFGLIEYTPLQTLSSSGKLAVVIFGTVAVAIPVMAVAGWLQSRFFSALRRVLPAEDAEYFVTKK